MFFEGMTQGRISGGTTVQPWKRAHVYTGAVAPPEKKASAS
jgi:hypothetical protein